MKRDHEFEFEFHQVIRREGMVIEVRERATGKLHTTIAPNLFLYMLEKAWREADDTPEESDECSLS